MPLPATFAGERVGVVGLGREGVALTRFLVSEGAHVIVSDRQSATMLGAALSAINGSNVTLNLGGHDIALLATASTVFVSPGVPRSLAVLVDLSERGVRLSSETELFFARCPRPITAITGSAGKTTTTTLVGEILEADGRDVVVAGNIGRAAIGEITRVGPSTNVVLELSSFQLQHLRTSPHVGAVLNLTPNHLDRHADMAEYVEAKRQIVAHQGQDDVAVLNADDGTTRALRTSAQVWEFSLSPLPSGVRGAFLDDDVVVVASERGRARVVDRSDLGIPGRHNVANAAAATAITAALGVGHAAMHRALINFRGVDHRLQHVAVKNGVVYINDSIATAPERLKAGIEAIESPLVLLVGGRDKHLPWREVADLMCRRARAIVTMGEAAPLIENAVAEAAMWTDRQPHIERVAGMEEAVLRASQLALRGDVVLLSPGCTSYDSYRDFEERGRDFAERVRLLADREATR